MYLSLASGFEGRQEGRQLCEPIFEESHVPENELASGHHDMAACVKGRKEEEGRKEEKEASHVKMKEELRLGRRKAEAGGRKRLVA